VKQPQELLVKKTIGLLTGWCDTSTYTLS